MNTNSQRIATIKLLKKGKAFFSTKDKLVKNWINYYEFSDGLGSGPRTQLSDTKSKHLCRACIIGAITLHKKSKVINFARYFLIRANDLKTPRLGFGLKHSFREVCEIYDTAIELAKTEELKEAY